MRLCPRLPLRRARYLTSPLYEARAIGFEGPAWGTCEFLRRRAQCPAVAELRNGPADFDLDYVFGAVLAATESFRKHAASSEGKSQGFRL